MGSVFLNISMSLDGYVAGRNVGVDLPMGEDGERVHDWMFAGKSASEVEESEVEAFRTVGAVVMGRRTLDLGIEPWGENPTFHAPCYVVTRRPHEPIVKQGGTSYTFITDGIEAALEQARNAAGEQDVVVMGGADVARQYLNAGLLDQVRLHLAPIVLGGGTRLFDGVDPRVSLTPSEASAQPMVTHLTYTLEPSPRPTGAGS